MFPNKLMACMDGPANLAAAQAEIAWLAQHFRCPIVVYHAGSPWSDENTEDATPHSLRAQLIDEVAHGPLFDGLDITVVCDTESRSVVPGILATAAHHDVDLVVMPVHPRRGISRILFRDAAEEMVKSCRIPVLTLDRDRIPLAPEDAAVDLVVAPTDFSDTARSCTRVAAGLALRLEAPLLVVHAQPDIPFTVDYEVTSSDIQEWMTKAAMAHLKEEIARLPQGVAARPAVELGSVTGVVHSVTRDAKNPLVVMSTAGRDSIGDLILGSRTERLVRAASCSVLAIPPAALERLVQNTPVD